MDRLLPFRKSVSQYHVISALKSALDLIKMADRSICRFNQDTMAVAMAVRHLFGHVTNLEWYKDFFFFFGGGDKREGYQLQSYIAKECTPVLSVSLSYQQAVECRETAWP